MTDQLETDLRAMLAARAAEITADAAGGEAAVAARLQTGDAALAEVVPLARPQRSRWPIAAAAAVAVVAVLGAAVWAAEDDNTAEVVTDPTPEAPAAIFTGVGSPESVAGSYVFDRLDLPPDQQLTLTSGTAGPDVPADHVAITWSFDGRPDLPPPTGGVVVLRDLGGANEWEVVESYSDGASIDEISRTATTITARSTGPAGSYLELSVHRLDGTSLSAGGCGGAAVSASGEPVDDGPVGCDLVDEPISYGDEPLTVRLSIVTADGEALTLEEHLVPPAAEGSPDATTTTTSSSTATSLDATSSIDDPTIGAPGDAAKDVAERAMLAVFGEAATTTSVEDRPGGGSWVNMDTPSGTTVSAEVVPHDGAWRVQSVRSSGFTDEARETLSVGVYEAGTVVVLGYADSQGSREICGAQCPRGPSVASAEVIVEEAIDATELVNGIASREYPLSEAAWISVTLTTPDGRVFYVLTPR